jgi:flavin reductase (DIM6/NTAB) family NADH-FMN oxidoreductase RutF
MIGLRLQQSGFRSVAIRLPARTVMVIGAGADSVYLPPTGEDIVNAVAPDPPLDPQDFRALFRRQAATVGVVTAAAESPVGFTVTSLTSVSLRPPLVSFCMARASSSWARMKHARYVAVHFLAHGQADVARHFATPGIDRFADAGRWRAGPYGVPLLHDVLAWLVCRIVDRIHAGDHDIVLLEPFMGGYANDGDPLVRHMGEFTAVARSAGVAQPRTDGGPDLISGLSKNGARLDA